MSLFSTGTTDKLLRNPGLFAKELSSCAIFAGVNTRSINPVSTAERGIPLYFADCSSWLMVKPPAALIALTPCAPSEPVPESTIPTTCSPRSSANEENSKSTDGFGPICETGSKKSLPSRTTTLLAGGVM